MRLKLYEDAIRSKKKTDTASAAASAENADSSDQQADDECKTPCVLSLLTG